MTVRSVFRAEYEVLALLDLALVLGAFLALADLWWTSLSQRPPTVPTAREQLPYQIRAAPGAQLPRLALEKDLLQADAAARTAAAAALVLGGTTG